MLRDGRPADGELPGDLADGHRAAAQDLQHRAPGRIAQGVELVVMVSHRLRKLQLTIGAVNTLRSPYRCALAPPATPALPLSGRTETPRSSCSGNRGPPGSRQRRPDAPRATEW